MVSDRQFRLEIQADDAGENFEGHPSYSRNHDLDLNASDNRYQLKGFYKASTFILMNDAAKTCRSEEIMQRGKPILFFPEANEDALDGLGFFHASRTAQDAPVRSILR